MNYFELFEIPVQLKVDATQIRKRYLELTRQFHPDYHVQTSGDEKQTALEQTAELNKAYKTLSSQDATIRYVLQLKGLLEDEEKYSLPPDFLMEMMELNESLAEAEMEADENSKTRLVQQLINFQQQIYEPVQDIVEHYKEGITTTEELLQVKEYYFKKKYLLRIAQQMGQKL